MPNRAAISSISQFYSLLLFLHITLLFILVWSANGHSSIINAIDGGGGKNTSSELPSHDLVTGSRDGSVKVI